MSVSDRTALLSLGEDDFLDDEEADHLSWHSPGRRPFSPPPAETPVFSCEPLRKQGLGHYLRLVAIRVNTSFARGSVLRRHAVLIFSVLALVMLSVAFIAPLLFHNAFSAPPPCHSVEHGYTCHERYSRVWGQYSPYYSLAEESAISPETPNSCSITFAQVLARHGARYPTDHKSRAYADLIRRIQHKTTSYSSEYSFIRNFKYTLGEEDMTAFGETQLVNMGADFYQRYQSLGQEHIPFIRASGSPRVIESAEKFIDGFYDSKSADLHPGEPSESHMVDVIIPETDHANNTLDLGGCPRFEDIDSHSEPVATFMSTFVPSVAERVNSNLKGADLESKDIIFLMEMCPFHTVSASPDASSLSPFCSLFTDHEWASYDYLQSLTKYYHYSAGNSLGATQGVGFVNELIARLTSTPVNDTTTTNSTLTHDPATFPLDRSLYADFSHDNAMLSIFTALGLFNSTEPLSDTTIQNTNQTAGYAVSWATPFGGRAYIEKMVCADSSEDTRIPYVRVLLNDRVVPLAGCPVDALGRCTLDDFVEGLSFARAGGDWEKCHSSS